MFAEARTDCAWSDRLRRSWTTLASFALQGLAIGGLLLLPLLCTQGLPRLARLAPLLAPAPPPALPPLPPHANLPPAAPSSLMASRLLGPSRIPPGVSRLTETVPPPPVLDLSGLAINHGIGDARGHGTVRDAIMGSGLGILPPALPAVHPLRISRMMEAHLIHRVEPRYPLLALQARRQGQVILRALISRAGMIEHLQLVSGHPLLAQAAIEAVSQWRYRPYVLNGEAVEVETQVTVNFYLSKD